MGLFDFLNQPKPVIAASAPRPFPNVGIQEQNIGLLGGLAELLIKQQKSKDDAKKKIALAKNAIEHPYDFESLESYYHQVPLVQAAVDKHVDFLIGADYTVRTPNTDMDVLFEKFMKRHNFDYWLRGMARNTYIFGPSFSEIQWNGAEIAVLSPIDSKSMYACQNEYGNISGFIQYMQAGPDKGGYVKTDFTPEEVIKISFTSSAGNPYGNSLFRALLGDGNISVLHQKIKAEEAVKVILERKANSPLHVRVGDENNMASQNDVNNITTAVEAMHNKTDWITSHLVSMSVIDFPMKTGEFGNLFDYYDMQSSSSLQVPQVLLGRGNVPEGLANVQMDGFQVRIKSHQNCLSTSLEDCIFKPMALRAGFHPDEVEQVNFYPGRWPTGADRERELTALCTLLQVPGISMDTRLATENKIRALIGIPGDVPAGQQGAFSFGGAMFGQPSLAPGQQPSQIFPGIPANAGVANDDTISMKSLGLESGPVGEDYQFFADMNEALNEKYSIKSRVYQFLASYGFGELSENQTKVPQIRKVLMNGVKEGWSLTRIINSMARVLGDKQKAEVLVKTELARAENEGALNAYEFSKQVEKVKWVTAGDERVDKHICLQNDGKIYTVEQARGVLPIHPHCRCTWSPVI